MLFSHRQDIDFAFGMLIKMLLLIASLHLTQERHGRYFIMTDTRSYTLIQKF